MNRLTNTLVGIKVLQATAGKQSCASRQVEIPIYSAAEAIIAHIYTTPNTFIVCSTGETVQNRIRKAQSAKCNVTLM